MLSKSLTDRHFFPMPVAIKPRTRTGADNGERLIAIQRGNGQSAEFLRAFADLSLLDLFPSGGSRIRLIERKKASTGDTFFFCFTLRLRAAFEAEVFPFCFADGSYFAPYGDNTLNFTAGASRLNPRGIPSRLRERSNGSPKPASIRLSEPRERMPNASAEIDCEDAGSKGFRISDLPFTPWDESSADDLPST